MSNTIDRIIYHMNQDHHLALVDYVVVYGKVPPAQFNKDSVRIIDVDETKILLQYDTADTKGNQLILIWNETIENENITVSGVTDIKSKLIAMAKYSAEKQGLSLTQFNKVWAPKKLLLWFMYALGAFLFTSSWDPTLPRKVISASPSLTSLTSAAPAILKSLAAHSETKVRLFTVAIYFTHIFEILAVSWPKLTKHRTSFSKKLLWALMHFFEGFLIFRRLDDAIES